MGVDGVEHRPFVDDGGVPLLTAAGWEVPDITDVGDLVPCLVRTTRAGAADEDGAVLLGGLIPRWIVPSGLAANPASDLASLLDALDLVALQPPGLSRHGASLVRPERVRARVHLPQDER